MKITEIEAIPIRGVRDYVAPLAKAAVAVGADGIIVEVHPHPDEALCDGQESLTPAEFTELIGDLRPIAKAVNVTLSELPT